VFQSQELHTALVNPLDVVLGKKIGSGGFKDVYKGTYQENEIAVAVVRTDKFSDDDMNDLENEVSLLKTLRHDNIVRFIGIAQVHEDSEGEESPLPSPKLHQLYILTEFCKFGDLSDYMNSRQKPSWQRQLNLLYDIAFGCAYLHNRRPAIIHRDLKSCNILIDKEERAKIADFGLSKVRKKVKARMHTVVGTINWQAPEIWQNNPQYTEKIDVYACGLIFWEVLQWGKTFPYAEMTDYQIYEQVGKKKKRPSLAGLKSYPNEFIELMQRMWDHDPDVRPDMTTVAQKLQEWMK